MAKRRKQPKRVRVPKPIRERRPPQQRGFLKMFDADPGPWAYWLILIAAFGYVLWANRDLAEGEQTLRWRETVGTVAETSVSKTTSGGTSSNPGRAGGGGTGSSSTWHVKISYRYEVEGRAYAGNRINWSTGWSYSNASDAHDKARRLEAQKTIPVFYDPTRPSQSILERGGNPGNLLIGVLMVGGAAGVLIYSYLKQRPVKQHLPPNKRRGPMIRRALLGGFIAGLVAGGLQYLAYLEMFA